MKENHQNWETNCLSCEDSITNPLCVDCLKKQLLVWTYEKAPKLTSLVDNIMDQHIQETQTLCIFCGQQVKVCSFCVTTEMLSLIKQKNPDLVENFVNHFGFYIEEVPDLLAM
ncbi:MAG: hypothetical protein MAG795_01044 [Candidatus Woesearchaeota archaeon]|nr:hypothetical protein [Candidatus Woesearchaeota archaeon]